MSNNSCIITFFYPGVENKIDNFFKSLKRQSDQKFDLIIFFNNKKNFLLPLNKLKITIFKLNKSIIPSRFEMIKIITRLNYTNYIFQDADDLMKLNRVKICKNLLKKHSVVINDLDIYGDKILKNYLNRRIKNNTIISAGDIINYNFCGMSNTAVRKKCLLKVNIPYTNKVKMFDWYLWTIILSKFRGIFTNKTSIKYYINKNSPTCIPTKYKKKINLKILDIKKVHKKIIDSLIVKKKIVNIKSFKKIKIVINKKYNFWWEKNTDVSKF